MGDGFIQLFHHELESLVWHELSGNAVKLYLAIKRTYHPENNGKLAFGARRAGKLLGKSKSTGNKALNELLAYGFLVMTKESTVHHPNPTFYFLNNNTAERQNYAREYRLTCYSYQNNEPTYDYRNKDPIEIWNIQNKHGFKASRKLSCEISRKVNKTHEDWVPDGHDA